MRPWGFRSGRPACEGAHCAIERKAKIRKAINYSECAIIYIISNPQLQVYNRLNKLSRAKINFGKVLVKFVLS
jgi:hypothetical protein